jgi:hypothetical protein
MFLNGDGFIFFFRLASPCTGDQKKHQSKNKEISRGRFQGSPPRLKSSESLTKIEK